MVSSDGVNGSTSHCDLKVVPQHVAIIMDGNGRWAKQRFLPRVEGHRRGAQTVRMVVEESRRLGIRYLSLFTFSSENWQRPVDEVSSLMKLFERYLKSEVSLMKDNGIRLRAIGERDRLPEFVQNALASAEAETQAEKGMDLLLAVSYGGRDEIVSAARALVRDAIQGKISPEEVDQGAIAARLYAPDVPDPDLLIRTSAESRISNFMLWQLAYSEIIVSNALWPEFSKEVYHKCLVEFSQRNRRYGLTEEQLNQQSPT